MLMCNTHKTQAHIFIMNAIAQFWRETYRLVSDLSFEEATFQAHLVISAHLFAKLGSIMAATAVNVDSTIKERGVAAGAADSIVTIFQSRLQHDFDSGFKLTTGLSMEKLWIQFRPTSISNAQTLQTIIALEKLAVRFDRLRWKVSILVSELANIMDSLVRAYQIVLSSDVDGYSLIKALDSELSGLEAHISADDHEIAPFLSSQFEALRQNKALQNMRSGTNLLANFPASIGLENVVLANHPTTSLMDIASATETSRTLKSIEYICGQSNGLKIIEDSFSSSLLRKLHHAEDVDLKSLRLLEAELPILGQQICQDSSGLCRDQVLDMNKILLSLIISVVAVHDEDFGAHINVWMEQITQSASSQSSEATELAVQLQLESSDMMWSGSTPHLEQIFQIHMKPALLAIATAQGQPESRLRLSAVAWVHFAIACITLYVPDRPYDPDKRQRLERQRYEEISKVLSDKMSALRQFENIFTGQNSSLRCQILEQELSELGEPAEAFQDIFRPNESELGQLQGEFNNLLNTILRAKPLELIMSHIASDSSDASQGIKLLQSNIVQIIKRLSERFRGYSDMTVPAVGMLRCLQVGLSIAGIISTDDSNSLAAIQILSKMTPFLGGGPLQTNIALPDQPLEVLEALATLTTVESFYSFDAERRRLMFDIFHNCFEQWTKRLEADRQEAESKTGLYRFKGSAEDEEEEDQEQFNELFPAYDGEPSHPVSGVSAVHSARDTAVALAKVHAKIVLGEVSPSQSIISLLRKISSRVGALSKADTTFSGGGMTQALLPGALLLLHEQNEALTSNTTTVESYNFYVDAHLPESRKLVTLVHQIQTRFQELQGVDEIGHMQPLEDVLVSCRELLEFRHTEPLAKIITKVEKVHVFMHEWQFGGWASRANTALALYDSLTNTIVSWRRLELSTWAKLFDMENKKCEDDAKSWWFVAYQVVIAAPLSICESELELRVYTQKLLQDLEVYFSSAIQGQYTQRLQLLKQLQNHLELLVLDMPLLSVVSAALKNFLEIYVRYESSVIENIRKGRASLEKAMREVLLLASWKDTNIVALRDSAKRSHHKLFKLVRKYRTLLGQPMELVLKQGLPEEAEATSFPPKFINSSALPAVDRAALVLCEKHVLNWSQKSKRFVNVSKTVALMDEATQFPLSAVEGSEYLNSFLENIIATTTELQKATPSVLTEENKVMVKHLKSRKRKLFADTIKDLRQMGIKHNLGTDALVKQESLSIVLANTEHLAALDGHTVDGLDYYYHKSLDLLPRAREATRQHSEDLSSAEVARGIGLLEGLLQVLLKQRNSLSSAVTNSNKLNRAINDSRGLWAPDSYNIKSSRAITSHSAALKWVPNILQVGSDLIKIHNKLGKSESKNILNILSSWIDRFESFGRDYRNLPSLPPSMESTDHQQLVKDINSALSDLHKDLNEMSVENPNLEFILQQVQPWTVITSQAVSDIEVHADLSSLDTKLSTICDSVLVAIEKLSKALHSLPSSTEDPAWLVKHDQFLFSSISSLHSAEVTSQIYQGFDILKTLDLENPDTSRVSGALFAVALPLFQQYFNTLQKFISRFAELHRSTCKMTYILAKTFIQIATQGFCTPSEKSEPQDGKTEKLEGGTGLGDGEGAEDISKDIQDDEDLSELAQEPNAGDKEEIEDEQDAVDMADGDMEGEMGDADEKGSDEEGSGDEEEDGDEMDEEAGDVDDLDPSAVDEKMWDGDGEKADKDQEGNESKGKASKDEQVAAQENDKQPADGNEGEEEEEEEMAGAEQSEEVKQQDDVEQHDPHAQDGENLERPEDMELDGGDEQEGSIDGSEDGGDDVSDIGEDTNEVDEMDESKDNNPDTRDVDGQEDQELGSDLDVIDPDDNDKEGEGDKTEDAGEAEQVEEDGPEDQPDEHEGLLRDNNDDDATADVDKAVPSDVQGAGEDQDENQNEDSADSASKAQREDGGKGGDSAEQRDAAAEEGDKGRQANGDAPQDPNEDTQATADAQPFKKLGDALEKWHRQQSKIREAPEQQDKSQEQSMEVNGDNSEFQHLQDENAEADAQALGTATEDQAHALDESMAIDSESKEQPDTFHPDEVDQDSTGQEDVMDLDEESEQKEPEQADSHEGRAGALIKQANPDYEPESEESYAGKMKDFEEEVEEVDTQLSSTHIEDPTLLSMSRSATDARQLWTHYESLTRDLSLSLTEQLRLILAPTLATKMRGDFRTGKRLNIKRIIPYIASQYKRDKIWMRRSVPSKRSYQIMLAVDDSKSMGESGSGSLAFETLVMVSKSLSMLEVGEICVVGFGHDVRVAHDFDMPFSSDVGPKVFQNFGFEQSRTDVTKLVRESIELFRNARAKASSSPADLWQLQLIISDGVCDSSEHEPIRRLLRQAIEERIMMVFVIVDDLKNKKKGESVMDLKEAKFVKDEMTGASNVKIERYLDTFPFQYYLIVSDVKELPGVLATLLRQWFAEVADSTG
jgi:midasin